MLSFVETGSELDLIIDLNPLLLIQGMLWNKYQKAQCLLTV